MRKRGQHLPTEKGDKKRGGAPRGNRNFTGGPRIGRHEPATPVAPHSGEHRQRRKRAKTGGRPFARGTNSHDGQVFRRGPDLIPRGNGTLMLRCVFHDFRERIYRSLGRLVNSPRGALAFMQEYIDRTEGRPMKSEGQAGSRGSTAAILLTLPDGTRVPAAQARQQVAQEAHAGGGEAGGQARGDAERAGRVHPGRGRQRQRSGEDMTTTAFLAHRESRATLVLAIDGFPALPPTLVHRLRFGQAPIRVVRHRAPLRRSPQRRQWVVAALMN